MDLTTVKKTPLQRLQDVDSGINHRALLNKIMDEIGGQDSLAKIVGEEINRCRGLHPDGSEPTEEEKEAGKKGEFTPKPTLTHKYMAVLLHHVRSDSEMQTEYGSMTEQEMFKIGKALLIDALINDEEFRRSIFKALANEEDVLADMRLYCGAVDAIEAVAVAK